MPQGEERDGKKRERKEEIKDRGAGFDISLSVDRKLKLPVGSNEISNYLWNTVSPTLIIHIRPLRISKKGNQARDS